MAHLVSDNLLASSFVELLRKRAVVLGMGARMLHDLEGTFKIPRMVGGATAYWVGEGGDVTKSAEAFDQIDTEPRTLWGRLRIIPADFSFNPLWMWKPWCVMIWRG
ncbi:phage major capsid protein [Pseudovibrio denitrificans]|uniref:phage major capsid family protein n=1 Tax=Pseudovibrio denitrificans TaxID=258256 RepID=UPI0039BF680F